MNKRELEARTKKFAIGVIHFVSEFDHSAAGQVISRQLLKSGTSIGANYREANRAVSRRDFTHKISIAEKEASETLYWLEICLETNLGDAVTCADLLAESRELLAIFTSIGRSMRSAGRPSQGDSSSQVSTISTSAYGGEKPGFDISDLVPSELAVENG
jgi:four helix bundle protein